MLIVVLDYNTYILFYWSHGKEHRSSYQKNLVQGFVPAPQKFSTPEAVLSCYPGTFWPQTLHFQNSNFQRNTFCLLQFSPDIISHEKRNCIFIFKSDTYLICQIFGVLKIQLNKNTNVLNRFNVLDFILCSWRTSAWTLHHKNVTALLVYIWEATAAAACTHGL